MCSPLQPRTTKPDLLNLSTKIRTCNRAVPGISESVSRLTLEDAVLGLPSLSKSASRSIARATLISPESKSWSTKCSCQECPKQLPCRTPKPWRAQLAPPRWKRLRRQHLPTQRDLTTLGADFLH